MSVRVLWKVEKRDVDGDKTLEEVVNQSMPKRRVRTKMPALKRLSRRWRMREIFNELWPSMTMQTQVREERFIATKQFNTNNKQTNLFQVSTIMKLKTPSPSFLPCKNVRKERANYLQENIIES